MLGFLLVVILCIVIVTIRCKRLVYIERQRFLERKLVS